MRILLIAIALLTFTTLAHAQGSPVIASAEEQARIKPLIEAETKAREALLAKVATLPESKAVSAAKEAYDKALAALNKAAEGLPESKAVQDASDRVMDEAARIQADHSLSWREYKAQLNDKGDLIFVASKTTKTTKTTPKP